VIEFIQQIQNGKKKVTKTIVMPVENFESMEQAV